MDLRPRFPSRNELKLITTISYEEKISDLVKKMRNMADDVLDQNKEAVRHPNLSSVRS